MGIVYFLGGKVYDLLDEHFEKTRYAKIRKRLLEDFKGNILDAGCGTGRNFPYYNHEACITGVDISPKMLDIARGRAKRSKASIDIREMDIKNLKFKGNTFDSVMASFVLCVMPKKYENEGLKELIRVVKPGGKIYFLEYVYSKKPFRKLIMKITSFIPKLLFSLRYNATSQIIKNERKVKIERLDYVHDDVVRLIVARKL